ncbi:DUF4494 domain-containing protein [Marivirga atlantica]|jgi:hypothetical protein|uniref:DUF4494 domain-containing protein n=1 Tax=Marivirga atlantica TaxID=1548457 RepID=A0A937A9B9_9BACT|nr:DUF4494 domain-containing protein [Marivirga atlantica]MBL0764640.1 DUF4494 domain-containing protein [Marivirga atlantica]
MKQWFLCKVKYQKEDENGRLKSVTEPYLVDAVSFTEAETRIYEEMGERVRGEFMITGISKSKIIDVFNYEDIDIWFKCKVVYYVAEESGKEKKIVNQMIVTAHNVKEAYDRIYESLNNMLVSFQVPEVIESPIIEVFNYAGEVTPEEEEEILDN